LFAVSAQADWPSWRGPSRDGVSNLQTPAAWPGKLNSVWSVEVGIGHSSPVTDGKHIFQHARVDDQEVVYCLNMAGEILWQKQYPAPYKMNNSARKHGMGPKSTPTISNGKLVTQGISGIVSCWNAADGKLLWQHDYAGEYKQTSPLFGTAASPLVIDDQCYIHAGMDNKGAFIAYESANGLKTRRVQRESRARAHRCTGTSSMLFSTIS
jgi:outer membrane protein assembly factor BamB